MLILEFYIIKMCVDVWRKKGVLSARVHPLKINFEPIHFQGTFPSH